MNRQNVFKHTTLAALAIALLAACNTPSKYAESRQAAEDTQQSAQQMAQTRSRPISSGPVLENDGFWVNPKAIETKAPDVGLPPFFAQQIGFAFNPRSSLRDATQTIGRAAGIRFVFAPELTAEVAAPILNATYRSDSSLRELLDNITSSAGVFWRWRDGQVEIYRTETRSFTIAAFAGGRKFTGSISNQSSSSGGGGTSASAGHSVSIDNEMKFWDGFTADVRQVISPNGKVNVSKETSTVTVTDLPQYVAAVEAFVREVNRKRMRMVHIDVQVLSVESTSESNLGINWDAVYKNLANNTSISFSSAAQAGLSAGGSATLTATLGGSGPWATSKAVINALATQGSVSLVNSFNQYTVTGGLVPLSVTRQLTYLAKASSTQTQGVGTQISLEPGVVTSGVSFNFMPVILSGEMVMLSSAVDLSNIDQIRERGTANISLQLPERSGQSTTSDVVLRSGQTLMLTGYQLKSDQVSRQGLGSAENDAWSAATGRRGGSTIRRTLVILVTPTITDPTLK